MWMPYRIYVNLLYFQWLVPNDICAYFLDTFSTCTAQIISTNHNADFVRMEIRQIIVSNKLWTFAHIHLIRYSRVHWSLLK